MPGRAQGDDRPPPVATDRGRQRQRRRHARVVEHPPGDHPRPQRPQPGLHQGLQHRHHRLPAGRGRRPHEQRRHHHRPPLADQAPGLGLRRRRARPGRGRRPPGRRPGHDPAPGRPHDAPHPHGPADGRLRARRQPVQHHPVGGVGRVRPGVHPPGLPRRHRPPRRGPVRLLRRLRLLPAGHPGGLGRGVRGLRHQRPPPEHVDQGEQGRLLVGLRQVPQGLHPQVGPVPRARPLRPGDGVALGGPPAHGLRRPEPPHHEGRCTSRA